MPEVNDNAAIFIATSFQALERAKMGDELTMICNCTVALVFAAFYIEENLDVVIGKLDKTDDMREFLEQSPNQNPGLILKLAWFYNHYIAREKANNRKQLLAKDKGRKYLISKKLEQKFPGFNEIHDFRNEIAHGKIKSSKTLSDVERLRQQAKDITEELLKIAKLAGCEIPKTTTYWDAVAKFQKSNSAF